MGNKANSKSNVDHPQNAAPTGQAVPTVIDSQRKEKLVYGFVRQYYEGDSPSMADELIQLCFEFFQALIFNTKILTMHEENMLHSVLQTQCQQTIEIGQYRLLYRASEHAYSASKYHELCDNHPHIVVIVHNVHDHVFGGYHTWKWDPMTMYQLSTQELLEQHEKAQNGEQVPRRYKRWQWQYDRDALLFLLRSASKAITEAIVYSPKCASKGIESLNKTIRYDIGSGPCFGHENGLLDIGISDRCNITASSHTKPGSGFVMKANNEICGGQCIEDENNGKYWRYAIKEYEVFTIDNLQEFRAIFKK